MNNRPMETHEIAEAIAMWARAYGYHISCGTSRISDTLIEVEAGVCELPQQKIGRPYRWRRRG